MNNPAPVAQWAQQNIPGTINISLPASSKAKVMVAKIVLVLIFGTIIVGLLYNFIEKMTQQNKVNTDALGIVGFFIAAISLLAWFINSKRKAIITAIDKNGLTTKGGKTHAWANLQSITLNKAMKKYSVNRQTFCYLIQFNFTTGQASASTHSPQFGTVEMIALQMPVSKKEKVNAMYR